MSATREASCRLEPHFVIDPTSRDGVLVRHDLSGRTWGMSAEGAADLVLAPDHPLLRELWRVDSATPRSLRLRRDQWIRRGWSWSLPLFLAAQRATFLDTANDWEHVHDLTLARYAEEGTLPLEEPRPCDRRLPPAEVTPSVSVGEVLLRRRSTPYPPKRRLPASVLAAVLEGALSEVVAERTRPEAERRRRPLVSVGTAFDIYITAYDVSGLPSGTFLLTFGPMGLVDVALGDRRQLLSKAMIGQAGPLRAACTITIVADLARCQWRYRHERAMTLLWMDAARLMSRLTWFAAAHDLGMQISPAVLDAQMLQALDLDENADVQVVYNMSVS